MLLSRHDASPGMLALRVTVQGRGEGHLQWHLSAASAASASRPAQRYTCTRAGHGRGHTAAKKATRRGYQREARGVVTRGGHQVAPHCALAAVPWLYYADALKMSGR